MKLVYNPFVSVGPIKLGDSIDKYLSILKLEYVPDEDNLGIDSYLSSEFDLSINVITRSRKIEFIICRAKLYYLKRNLIQMDISEFLSYSGQKFYGEIDIADFEDNGPPQQIYEFDDIGLQIWVRNNVIVTAIASKNC